MYIVPHGEYVRLKPAIGRVHRVVLDDQHAHGGPRLNQLQSQSSLLLLVSTRAVRYIRVHVVLGYGVAGNLSSGLCKPPWVLAAVLPVLLMKAYLPFNIESSHRPRYLPPSCSQSSRAACCILLLLQVQPRNAQDNSPYAQGASYSALL